MYVARFTKSPEYDTKRNWSAWIGGAWDSKEDAVIELLNGAGIDSDEIEAAWENWQDEEWRTWHHRDHSDYSSFLSDMADTNGIDIRYNSVYAKWQHVHHDGLSCWRLAASSLEDAIVEAQTAKLAWHGFGDTTSGNVRHVSSTSIADLHIFECDEVWTESEL